MLIQASQHATKHGLFMAARVLCEQFCAYNKIPIPNVIEWKGESRSDWYGYYTTFTDTCHIHVGRSRSVGRRHHPGGVQDCTAAGVLAHEVGHHVWHHLSGGLVVQEEWDNRNFRWTSVVVTEPVISDKDYSREEAFAEALRLFILNPSLLEAGRPGRYGCLTEIMGLYPLLRVHWTDVLKYADPVVVERTTKWIGCQTDSGLRLGEDSPSNSPTPNTTDGSVAPSDKLTGASPSMAAKKSRAQN